MTCAIWGTAAQVFESAGDYQVLDSPRAGGQYWISGTAAAQVVPLTDLGKRLLTTWICEQRTAGVEVPRVDSQVLELIKSRQPLPIMTRMTRALQHLGAHVGQLGEFRKLIDMADPEVLSLLAVTESKSLQEASQLIQMLEEVGFTKTQAFISGGVVARPTALGWQEIDRLKLQETDSSQAFVAMWFSQETSEAYEKAIAPALGAVGYKPVRIDKKEHNNKIDDEIIAEIRRSRFLVADFTCEAGKVRGGVYYEAGFAQGLGLPVIWTCKETSINDLHFDTRQYSHIVWKDTADLLEQLKNRVGATIGDGPLPKL